ncbi:hypothetical protein TSUD_218940 [Trifolium subterraneum]|uniref:Uncharacterized protein n=1 Tax=Trifolium subterraneum TaxID=3900 RepID=A0A2Z6N9L7_TRISU|nr:hypothetical protein TSUD_218940 [Trifolium subterraneum]
MLRLRVRVRGLIRRFGGSGRWRFGGSVRSVLRFHFSAGDIERETSFVVYNDVARKMAPLACDQLLRMNRGSSAYHIELDEAFGDAMLFKCLVCPSPGFPLACAGENASIGVGVSIYGSSTGSSSCGDDGFDDFYAVVDSSPKDGEDLACGSCVPVSKRQKTV